MIILSVIIPTHNRARYAIPSIKSILELSDQIQVVVCDSSPVDEISTEFQNLYPESRLKLVRSLKGISVVDNFNLGLQSADGEYLVFIGDDDFISKEVIEVASWAKENNVDAIKFNFPALYYWDDFKHSTRGDSYFGTLHLSPFTGKVSRHDVKSSVDYALDNFGGGVFGMPRAYAGMISSSLAKRIEGKYMTLFGGVSPDIYSSLLIATESTSCVLIDYPVIVPGASGQSTSGKSVTGGHYGKLRDNPHIAPFKNLAWDARIPEFYSVPTVWSYSLLKAVEQVESQGGKSLKPNFGRLLLKCFVYFPGSYIDTIAALKASCAKYGYVKLTAQMIVAVSSEFFWGVSRIINRVRARHIEKDVEVFDQLHTTLIGGEKLRAILDARDSKIKFSESNI
ncbi:glycosyltransferase family 2 protein [Pseudomonas proteolytica]|uniref:glycosyltransferase family 2 protein n=1 Tax=Pseudomonas proteolytica TaxID=219574 RepID=UPI001473DCC2|nr:glycosyltransferase family 2 protein [Pseudomonas proteolytica]NMZ01708.1 glycosyltransferase family 2 protein [Pseudomonas proteolytica]